MVEINSCIDVTDQDRRTSASNRMRLGRMNLPHVPLKTREAVGVGGRSVWQVARLRPRGIIGFGHVVLELGGEFGSRGGAVAPAVFDGARSEACAIGICDGH